MEFLIPARASRPSDDPIFALHAEAKARAAAGQSVVNATVGALLDDEGRLAVLPSVVQALREVPAEAGAAYAPIAGNPDFLRAVVRDLLGELPGFSGLEARTAAVATVGGTGALRHAIANFLEPGQKLLTSSFFWGPYRTLADENDRGLETFRTFDERGRFDVASLKRELARLAKTQGRALAILNSPCHNPTGYSLDEEEWDGVAGAALEAAAEAPVVLVVDVAYARYAPEGLAAALPRLAALSERVPVLFAWSASKSFAQYGLRLGALVALCPDEAERVRVQSALVYACRGTWSNVTAAGMSALSRILTEPELGARVAKEREALRDLLARRVARWNALAKPAGLAYPRYDGGFFTTVFDPDAHAASVRLKEEGIFAVPQAGALRVALCSVPERDLDRLVAGIARVTTRAP